MEDHLTPPIELGEEISPQRQQQQNRQQEQQSSYNIKLHMRDELRRVQLPVCTVAALQQAIRAIYRDFGGGKLFYKGLLGPQILMINPIKLMQMTMGTPLRSVRMVRWLRCSATTRPNGTLTQPGFLSKVCAHTVYSTVHNKILVLTYSNGHRLL
jgi:hypothetical protein